MTDPSPGTETPVDAAALVSRLGHDFNNLLSVIIGGLSLLRDELPEPAWNGEAQAIYDDILSASTDAAEVVVQLTAWAGRQLVEPRATDLNATLTSLEPLIARSLPPEVALTLDLDPEPVMAWVDPDRLQDCLLNLVANARDAMGSSGTLRLSTQRAPAPGLRVCDDGEGMTPQTLARCRHPYFSTRDRVHHRGFGLSLVDGFARASGGRLEVQSEPGNGTEVALRFDSPRAQ